MFPLSPSCYDSFRCQTLSTLPWHSRFLGSAIAPFNSRMPGPWTSRSCPPVTVCKATTSTFTIVAQNRSYQGNTIPGFGDVRERHRQVFTE